MIKIIGLGPGDKDALTIGVIEVLKNNSNIFLRTERHPTVQYLKELGIKYKTYDEKYEESKDFDEVYDSIAEDIIKKQEELGDVVYAVPGHPLVAEKSVENILKLCKEKNIAVDIYPAVSFIDSLMDSLRIDPIEGIKIIDAFDIKNQLLDKRTGIIVTQVYDKYIASEVKIALSEYYSDEMEIYFVRAAGVKGMESIRKIPLYELDRQDDIDHLTSVYIPKCSKSLMDFYDLVNIMEILRGENGCPWDREQTHESLKKYLIEESYETLEAIDEKDDEKLVEELGDVLLQVIFHAQLGKEDGYYNINDIISGICNKMINRHPHVFGNIEVNTSEEVLNNWDKIKMKEQGLKNHTEELKHVANNLPALMRADKIQRKAAKVGFDWDKIDSAMSKVLEELDEIKCVYKTNNKAKILEEVGDLIFSTVNVARFLDIDPEIALNSTITKFIKRFEYIEKSTLEKGLKMEDLDLKTMDELWEEAKSK
jgi:tetrapyrrole methylase family protein/MazG family protein